MKLTASCYELEEQFERQEEVFVGLVVVINEQPRQRMIGIFFNRREGQDSGRNSKTNATNY